MVRKLFGAAAGLALLALSGSALAHDVHVEGQVRIRYEGEDRSFASNSDMSHAVWQRTRISADVRNDKGARVFIQLSDSRVWGDEGSTLSDTDNVDVHQAFAHLTSPLVDGMECYLGRQELSYGSERVIGAVDWSNVGRSFDALRTRYGYAEGQWVDVAWAKVSEDSATGIDENVAFLVWHLNVPDTGLQIEPLVIYSESSSTVPGSSQYLTSIGDYASYKSGRFRAQQNFVWQTGTSTGHDASAYLLDADVKLDVSNDADGSLGIGAGFSIQSGDDPDDPDDTAYDNLFVTGHKFHGIMDIAQDLADRAQGEGAGLRDYFGHGWIKTSTGYWLKAAVHFFKTDQDIVAAANDNDLGTEFDVVISKDLASGMDVQIGGGVFSPGSLFDGTNDETASWIYAQGTVTF